MNSRRSTANWIAPLPDWVIRVGGHQGCPALSVRSTPNSDRKFKAWPPSLWARTGLTRCSERWRGVKHPFPYNLRRDRLP
jgi:hypothetical protein